MRCLKRRISDAVYRQLVADARAAEETATLDGPRALRATLEFQRGRPAPARRHFGSATSPTRGSDATRTTTTSEPHAARQPDLRAGVLTATNAGASSQATRRGLDT